MNTIGIIGLGRMGGAMAQRLVAQGQPVITWTRSGRALDGIAASADLAGLVAQSDVLISSLYDDTAVAEVLDAVLDHDLRGKLIVETSTVTPQILTDRAEALTAKGAEAVDAPISGGPEMVTAGTCGIFIGGSDTAAARAKDVLSRITPKCGHVGPLGAGMVMKTINNSMMQAYVAGLREMLPLARKAGIPLETVMGVLNTGPAGLQMIRDRMPKIMGDDQTVGFPLTGILKDNEVFRRVVADYGLRAGTLDVANAHHRVAIADGLGDKDPAAAIAAAYDKI